MEVRWRQTVLVVLFVSCGLVVGQTEITDISTEEFPDLPEERFNALVNSSLRFSSCTYDERTNQAFKECLREDTEQTVNVASVFVPEQDASSDFDPRFYTVSIWSEMDTAVLQKFQEGYITAVNSGNLSECIGEKTDREERCNIEVLKNPNFFTFVDETARIPYWAMYIVAGSLFVILALALVILSCLKRRKPLNKEEDYIEYIGVAGDNHK
mmetsp:Transcript_2173/g.6471  ORF Transcript_2173/g.6471 Transcript_2173/m.6471 type:complete len:212 (+) Transcript_2173:115-750(+)